MTSPNPRFPFRRLLLAASLLLLAVAGGRAQGGQALNREEAVAYALAHAPELLAAREELGLTELDNQIALSAWFPEVYIAGNAQHYFQRPVSIFPDFNDPESGATREVEVGTINSATATVGVRQTIYNPTVAFALRRQSPLLQRARLEIEATEIDLRDRVNRAWYGALRTNERLRLLRADVERQERALREARLRFEEGLNDKVDYKRATITLNQTRLELRNGTIELSSRLAELKEVMGYPADEPLDLLYDIEQLTAEVFNAPLTPSDSSRRVELRQLDIEDDLLALEVLFYRQAWLPDVYLGGSYNINWFSNRLPALFDQRFPNALASVNVSVPLFSGGRRFRQVAQQRVLREQLAFRQQGIVNRIDREYLTAVNAFEQARNAYAVTLENLELAEEIYQVVDLQYREGITTYLSVIIAENDLAQARQAMVDSLVDAALARVEVQRAAGTL